MDIKKINVIKSKLSGGEGYDHFSPTQLTSPIAKYIIDYVMVNQEERRKAVKGYKLHFGSSVNNVAQKCVAKYIFERKEDGTFGKQINEYTRDIKKRTK